MERIRRFVSHHRNGVVFVILITISTIAIGTQSQSVSSASKQVGYSVLSSVQYGVAEIGHFFRNFFNSIGELRRVRQEYEVLQEKVTEYQTIERDLLDLKKENEQLRALLGFSEELQRSHVAARIIAKEPGLLFEGFTINRGSNDGIKVNSPVIAYAEGFSNLVGKVVEATATTAKVLPIIDRSCFVAAKMRESRYEGLVHGMGASEGLVEMTYIKKQAKNKIQFGDLVVTSGFRSIYPEDLYIGRVDTIKAPEWESSLTLQVRPLVDFTRLEYVFVLVEQE
jgi:rod shape-determining protein MreC